MPSIPYFSLSRHSFEKNSGYKSTVHALAELIDNSVEADAKNVVVVLMIDRDSKLQKIAVVDNGTGMSAESLQRAICEKSGDHLDRQNGSGSSGRRKFGKYGVGLPKASISQCNKFTVWSWKNGGPSHAFKNGIDIEDEAWIQAGAKVMEAVKEPAPVKWLEAAGLQDAPSGTVVIWERLDGLTWARARWGDNSGLIPNLEFNVGRTYRRLISGDKPELKIHVQVITETFRKFEPVLQIGPNDPLYITPGCKIPRFKLADGSDWPTKDPLFQDLTGSANFIPIELPTHSGPLKLRVTWRRSAALKETFSQLGGRDAGSLPHGKHAAHNVGLSLLREGREVEMSQALSVPSEPRERWFGVEFDFPHELDAILGMTNNKQSYTRLDQVLKNRFGDYQLEDESTVQCIARIRREDPNLAICLEIAWKIEEVWTQTKRAHMVMREEMVEPPGLGTGKTPPVPKTPEEAAEAVASSADKKEAGDQPQKSDKEREEIRRRVINELKKSNVPEIEAEPSSNLTRFDYTEPKPPYLLGNLTEPKFLFPRRLCQIWSLLARFLLGFVRIFSHLVCPVWNLAFAL